MPQLDLNGGKANPIPKPVYTSKSDEWGTPQDLFDKLDREFHFTLDPCANKRRPLRRDLLCYDIQDNVLEQDWSDHRVFINPPYSGKNIEWWCEKIYQEKDHAEVIVLLIPLNKGSTEYFHEYIYPFAEIRMIRGRLKFYPLVSQRVRGTPNGSMLCIIR